MKARGQAWRDGLRWGGTLKARLALACVLVIAVSVFSAAALALSHARERTAGIIQRAEVANAQRLADILGQRLQRLEQALRAAAGVVPIDRMEDPQALTDYMRQRQVTMTLFSTFSLIDSKGRVRVAREGNNISFPAIDLGDRAHIRNALRGLSGVSDPVVSRLVAEPMIYFTMPVRRDDGSVVAALSGGLRLSSRDLVADLVTGSGGAAAKVRALDAGTLVETVVIDRGGQVLAHPDARRVAQPVQDDAQLADIWRLIRPAAAGPTPTEPTSAALMLQRLDPRSGEGRLIVAAASVPRVDWLVLRVAPARQMLAGFDAARSDVALLSLGVALLAGLFVLAWTAWLMRPLEQLERRARRLGHDAGAAQAEDWPQATGEIGSLVQALREAVQRRGEAEATTANLMGKMHSMLHTAPIGIAFTRERCFELVSDELCALLGYEPADLVGESTQLIYASQAEYEQLGDRVVQAFSQRREFVTDCEFVRHDGSRFLGELRGRPIKHDDPSEGTIWLLRDVTAERAERRELAWSASHDPLTGLSNRRHFEAELQRLLPQIRADSPAAALFIDLDRFKAINDTAGHAAGDRVLREVAVALAASVRRDELVARLGGDEFAIVLAQCDFDAALRVAEKVRAAIERIEIHHDGQRLPVGASVGVVAVPPGLTDAADVLSRADRACYAAKAEGRNRVHGESPAAELSPTQRAPA